MQPLLQAKAITKAYSSQDSVLKGVDLSLAPETFTVLLGPSGCGKSTLLNILAGLLRPTSGEVWYQNEELTAFSPARLDKWKREQAGLIFQNYLLLSNLTVAENILLGSERNADGFSLEELAGILQLADILEKFPHQLSGGQQQRAAIARAAVKNPSVLFCDEATGALDEENSKLVVDLLHRIKKESGSAILFVTHNAQIARTANRVITMKDGLIQEDKINTAPISAFEMDWI